MQCVNSSSLIGVSIRKTLQLVNSVADRVLCTLFRVQDNAIHDLYTTLLDLPEQCCAIVIPSFQVLSRWRLVGFKIQFVQSSGIVCFNAQKSAEVYSPKL